MISFLTICAVILLVITLLSTWRIMKHSPRKIFEEMEAMGLGNGNMQTFYAVTGLYLFYVLTVMNYVRPLTVLGILTALDSLLFLLFLRRMSKPTLLTRYYRNGIGEYISALLTITFLVATIWITL